MRFEQKASKLENDAHFHKPSSQATEKRSTPGRPFEHFQNYYTIRKNSNSMGRQVYRTQMLIKTIRALLKKWMMSRIFLKEMVGELY